jgi:hypothetical protein
MGLHGVVSGDIHACDHCTSFAAHACCFIMCTHELERAQLQERREWLQFVCPPLLYTHAIHLRMQMFTQIDSPVRALATTHHARYVSTLFPGLSAKGAYSQRATYSPDELKSLVDYAESRGVRIMPEFDMPGHGDWEQGEPQIMVTDGPCKNTMNPTKPQTCVWPSNLSVKIRYVPLCSLLFHSVPLDS